MGISILHKNDRASGTEPISDKVLYHLSLDRTFSQICADKKKREYFFRILLSTLKDEAEVIYRQEVLKDLVKYSELLEGLISLSKRFFELIEAQKNAGREARRLVLAGTESRDAAKNILQAQALTLKRALTFVKAYRELLVNYELTSEGLLSLSRNCAEICDKPEFSELITFCSKYENFSECGYWDFRFSLNDDGYINGFALADHRYILITDPELKKKGFSIFKKTEEIYPCARLYPKNDGYFDRLAVSALSELSSLFESVSNQIFEKFGGIEKELDFYYVASEYIKTLSDKNVPIAYPRFSQDNSIRVKRLYDLYLLVNQNDVSRIEPNDFILGTQSGGMLLFGDNGSGKTVYLRSVGTMQLLTSAGLPVPCESAETVLFTGIVTHFSESEKEFCAGNEAGRFEQEVRELAKTVDGLAPGSLVLLNEVFQSTAYSEGADALYYLLKHFTALSIRWVLVTHLTQLENRLSPTEATVHYATENYRIK